MTPSPGLLLTSTSSMDDPVFFDSVLFITEYNDAGAMAFVVNKIFERPLNHLVEFRHSPPFPLHAGGPVDIEHLYFIHRRPDLIIGGVPVINDVFLGGDFAQAVRGVNNGSLTQAEIKIFVGYCGWDAGELEAEIEEGSWSLSGTATKSVFA